MKKRGSTAGSMGSSGRRHFFTNWKIKEVNIHGQKGGARERWNIIIQNTLTFRNVAKLRIFLHFSLFFLYSSSSFLFLLVYKRIFRLNDVLKNISTIYLGLLTFSLICFIKKTLFFWKASEILRLLVCIRFVPTSNLSPNTKFPVCGFSFFSA